MNFVKNFFLRVCSKYEFYSRFHIENRILISRLFASKLLRQRLPCFSFTKNSFLFYLSHADILFLPFSLQVYYSWRCQKDRNNNFLKSVPTGFHTIKASILLQLLFWKCFGIFSSISPNESLWLLYGVTLQRAQLLSSRFLAAKKNSNNCNWCSPVFNCIHRARKSSEILLRIPTANRYTEHAR